MKRYRAQFLLVLLALQPVMMCGMQNAPAAQINHNCGVCGENFSQDEVIHLACGHIDNCIYCVRDNVRAALNAREFGRIRCPHQGCEHRLAQAEVYQLIEQPDLRAVYDRLRIQTDPNGRFCPTPNCNHGYLYDPAQGRRSNYECPECRQHYCNNCLLVHDRNAAPCQRINGGLDAVRGNPNYRACPRCQRPIFREGGCNYIRCECNYEFCWMCLVPDPHHRHVRCLPEDLARARAIYGEGGGVPNNQHDIFGQRYVPPVDPNNIPVNQPINNPYRPLNNNWQPRPPHDDDTPFIILGVIGGIVGVGLITYATIKIWHYFEKKKAKPKDLRACLDELVKEATKKKQQAEAGNEIVVAGQFKLFFDERQNNNYYAGLEPNQLVELVKLVDALVVGMLQNNSDRAYMNLVKFVTVFSSAEPSQAQPRKSAVPVQKVIIQEQSSKAKIAKSKNQNNKKR